MFTSAPLHRASHDLDVDVTADAQHLLENLHRRPPADGSVPSRQQIALTLRALSDFPLCMRILPQSGYRRLGQPAAGVARYLAGFASHLERLGQQRTYDPQYWILGAPVTDRLWAKITEQAGGATPAPTARQAATVLLALADTEHRSLPARVVEVAGDGDLPWNGATGIGLWLRRLAEIIDPSVG